MQSAGFGSNGFRESHAASFALVVSASVRPKRWHPDAFRPALRLDRRAALWTVKVLRDEPLPR